jgi:hypothetical protein
LVNSKQEINSKTNRLQTGLNNTLFPNKGGQTQKGWNHTSPENLIRNLEIWKLPSLLMVNPALALGKIKVLFLVITNAYYIFERPTKLFISYKPS